MEKPNKQELVPYVYSTEYLTGKSDIEIGICLQQVGKNLTDLGYHICRYGNYKSLLLLFTVGGKGTLRYLGKTYELQMGTIMFIDCNIAHEYYGDSWEFVWVHMTGATSEGYYSYLFNKHGPVFSSTYFESHLITLSMVLNLPLKLSGVSGIETAGRILVLLNELGIESSETEPQIGQNAGFSKVSKALDYLQKNYSRPISLEFNS